MKKQEIDITSDYERFSFHPAAQNLVQKTVKKLIASMKRLGFLLSYPILVTSTFEVVDGMHRYMAAKTLGLPIYFIVVDYDYEDMERESVERSEYAEKFKEGVVSESI